jgi:hypothetical protein
MFYMHKLIHILFFGLFACSLWAQDTRYRVEVLVLTHLRSVEPATEVDEITDYSSALDFLTPVEEPEEGESEDETAGSTDETAGAEQEGTAGEPFADEEAKPDPNEVVHHEEMSEVMQEAWRRLRLSAPFRPQQYLSWEQGNQEPFPALRIHDLEVVLVKDPEAWERLKMIEADLLEDESEQKEKETLFVTSGDTTPDSAGGLVELSQGTEVPQEPELPEAVPYYRLDGTVTLRRSRFLHLDLDVQMREGIWEPEPLEILARDPVIFERAGPTLFRVHNLQQSRQVKSGRMEYFDGPVLSLLAFITAIEVESGDDT